MGLKELRFNKGKFTDLEGSVVNPQPIDTPQLVGMDVSKYPLLESEESVRRQFSEDLRHKVNSLSPPNANSFSICTNTSVPSGYQRKPSQRIIGSEDLEPKTDYVVYEGSIVHSIQYYRI